MILWVDAQLSPALSPWLSKTFDLSCEALRHLGLRNANDREIFLAARKAGATVMTKDSDFVRLLEELGPPKKIIWVVCGNTSNANLKQVLTRNLSRALAFLEAGEPLVEIG